MKLNALRSNIISSRDSKLFSGSLGRGGPVLIQSISRKERIVMWKKRIFSLFFSSSSFFSFGTITCLVVSTADSREMNKQQMNINGDFGNSWSRLVWQLCGHVGSTPTYRNSLLINWSCFTWCILHALHILLFHELESHGFVVINYSTSLRKLQGKNFLALYPLLSWCEIILLFKCLSEAQHPQDSRAWTFMFKIPREDMTSLCCAVSWPLSAWNQLHPREPRMGWEAYLLGALSLVVPVKSPLMKTSHVIVGVH